MAQPTSALPKPSQSEDTLLYLIAAAVVLALLYQCVSPLVLRIVYFWQLHSKQIILCFWFSGGIGLVLITAVLWNKFLEWRVIASMTEKDKSSIYLGKDVKTQKQIHLKESFRTTHTQLIGTTNAGKTASVIMPWAVQDIAQGRGLLIVDGKSDGEFLEKLYAYAVQHGRAKDFLVFSLANPHISKTFNPFCQGTPEQITERVFSAFSFTDEYYRGIQFSALRTVVALLQKRGEQPMPGVIRELLRNKETLQGWLVGLQDKNLIRDVEALLTDGEEEFSKKYSGLVTALGHFSQGDAACLFNTRYPEIKLSEILQNKKICYFQLPTMLYPFLGEATGKLLLQCLQSSISELQVGGEKLKSLFSVFLDDFNDYIYPGFVSLLNKSRSANVGVVFAHQSLGDLEKVSSDFKQIVLTNTNIKIIMRSNDPESAEHFAKTIGTITTEKTTERRKHSLLGKEDTGDQSVRDVEEYVVHPNLFKSELKRGEGVVLIPHPKGRYVGRIEFKTVPDLPSLRMPVRDLPQFDLTVEATFRGVDVAQIKTPRRASPV